MSTRIARWLELLSNVAVIIAAVTVVAILVRREWPAPEPGAAENLQGATINLPALIGTAPKRSLVMFISETCHFCEQEMSFYRTLREALPRDTTLVAVFPRQESEPPVNFLAARSVRVDNVAITNSLIGIGVRSTPTLLLVDADGRVRRAWIGAQPEAAHRDIVASAGREL
jgi:hypothetical protein